ncbi:MAG TPA: response regulator [Roseiflexaceae bacterium]|nr:response regulator [Roseiflexaceae bacterium]
MARILIVEDEANIVKLISMRLERLGHAISSAASGSAALEIARERMPELILLDVMLPDLNGFQVLQRLKADSATALIPVLMLTARGHEQDIAAGLEAGAEDYIIKPFSFPELIARVSTALARHARSQA